MIPLHCDPYFTFRFADDRLVPRFHLEGSRPGGGWTCSASTRPPACGSAC